MFRVEDGTISSIYSVEHPDEESQVELNSTHSCVMPLLIKFLFSTKKIVPPGPPPYLFLIKINVHVILYFQQLIR